MHRLSTLSGTKRSGRVSSGEAIISRESRDDVGRNLIQAVVDHIHCSLLETKLASRPREERQAQDDMNRVIGWWGGVLGLL